MGRCGRGVVVLLNNVFLGGESYSPLFSSFPSPIHTRTHIVLIINFVFGTK